MKKTISILLSACIALTSCESFLDREPVAEVGSGDYFKDETSLLTYTNGFLQKYTPGVEDLGYGDGYRYAHDEPGAYAAGEIYLPEGLEGRHWYHPTDRGIDAKIRDRMARFKALNEAAWAEGKGRKR